MIEVFSNTKLFNRSCLATSSLNNVSISFFKVLLFVSSIFRKSSCDKLETMVDSSLDSDVVVLVLVEFRSVCLFGRFYFLFSDSWE